MSRTIKKETTKGYGDKKPSHKPPKSVTKKWGRSRRAKTKHALRQGKEPPRFKKDDVWNFN